MFQSVWYKSLRKSDLYQPENIRALEDYLEYYIDYTELQYLYNNYPEFNFIGRVVTEKYYQLIEQRLYSLRMQKAFENYNLS